MKHLNYQFGLNKPASTIPCAVPPCPTIEDIAPTVEPTETTQLPPFVAEDKKKLEALLQERSKLQAEIEKEQQKLNKPVPIFNVKMGLLGAGAAWLLKMKTSHIVLTGAATGYFFKDQNGIDKKAIETTIEKLKTEVEKVEAMASEIEKKIKETVEMLQNREKNLTVFK